MTERTWTTDFNFDDKSGQASIEERGPKDDEKGYYTIKETLLERNTEIEARISIGIDDGSDLICLRLHFAHAENPTTKRAFHVYVSFDFDATEMEALRNYLSFLVGRP
jgi:hypothetical protein